MSTAAETNPVIMALLSIGELRRASFVQAMQNTYRFAFAQDKAARKTRTERSLFNQSRFEYVSDLFEKRRGITLNENGTMFLYESETQMERDGNGGWIPVTN